MRLKLQSGSKSRIFFIASHYAPERNAPAKRIKNFSRYFAELDEYEITVITPRARIPSPGHPEFLDTNNFFMFSKYQEDGIEICRFRGLEFPKGIFILELMNYLSEFFGFFLIALLKNKPDLIITSSPQPFTALIGYLISRIKNTLWIIEIRDIWPESLALENLELNLVKLAIAKYFKFLYRSADRIICVNESQKAEIAEIVDESKISVVMNSSDLFESGYRCKPTSLFELERKTLKICYVGTIGRAQGLEVMIDALSLLSNKTRDYQIWFYVVGDGSEKESIRLKARNAGLQNVIFSDYLFGSDLLSIYKDSDIGFIHLKEQIGLSSALPSKLFDYLAVGLPVLIGSAGCGKQIIEEYGAGWVFESGDAAALCDVLMGIAQSESEMGKKSNAAWNSRWIADPVVRASQVRAIVGELLNRK